MSKLKFFVLEEDTYKAKYEHNMGNYSGDEQLVTKLQLWNNRYGTEDTDMVTKPTMYFYYKNVEDNNLLNYYTLKVDGRVVDFVIQNNKAIVVLPRLIVGDANNGTEENTGNYVSIELVFDAANETLKNNDLKELYVEIR